MGGYETTLVESAPFLGAGVRTNWYGGHPYLWPGHFLTPYEDVYEYINKIIPIRNCNDHEFVTYVERDDDFHAYPINMQDVKSMPDYDKIKLKWKKLPKIKLMELFKFKI